MCPGALFLQHFPGYSKPIIHSFSVSQFSCNSLSLMPKPTPSFSISSPNKVLCPADFISATISQFGSYYQCPTSFPDGLSAQPFQQTPTGSPNSQPPLSSHSILQSFQLGEEASWSPWGQLTEFTHTPLSLAQIHLQQSLNLLFSLILH